MEAGDTPGDQRRLSAGAALPQGPRGAPAGRRAGVTEHVVRTLSILAFLDTKRGVLKPARAPADSLEVCAAKGDL